MRHPWRTALSWARGAIVPCIVALLAGAAAPELPPSRSGPPADPARVSFKAVLVAGDGSEAAFDHATAAMRDRLLARFAAQSDVQRLSASSGVVARDGAGSSTLGNVLAAIEHLHPAAGQGCFLFATSHGSYEDGLVLVPSENFLTPAALDRSLAAGCGDAPTVVIISGCFSGGFAGPPMARANRIVLTAARADRPSFGCGAGFQYTVYDRCLLTAIDRSPTWLAAYDDIRRCVAARERAFRFRPSEPRAWFGEAVRTMPLPGPP